MTFLVSYPYSTREAKIPPSLQPNIDIEILEEDSCNSEGPVEMWARALDPSWIVRRRSPAFLPAAVRLCGGIRASFAERYKISSA